MGAPEPGAALEALVERVVLALDEPFEVGVDNLRLTVSTAVHGQLSPGRGWPRQDHRRDT